MNNTGARFVFPFVRILGECDCVQIGGSGMEHGSCSSSSAKKCGEKQ